MDWTKTGGRKQVGRKQVGRKVGLPFIYYKQSNNISCNLSQLTKDSIELKIYSEKNNASIGCRKQNLSM